MGAPNAPMARLQAMAAPTAKLGEASGRMTLRKTRAGRQPSDSATSRYRAGTAENPVQARKTKYGAASYTSAVTRPANVLVQARRVRLSGPNRAARVRPTTSGGS